MRIMGNTCCSGESVSNDEKKEVEQLQEKRYEYPQKVEVPSGSSLQQQHQKIETTVPKYKASEISMAEAEGYNNQAKITVPNKPNDTLAGASEENDYSQQIQNAIWPPPVNHQQDKRDGTSNYSGIQNKTMPTPPPLESNTARNNATGLNDSIEHNIWPPPPTDSYTKGDNTIDFVSNIWPPPPSDNQPSRINADVSNATHASNTQPPLPLQSAANKSNTAEAHDNINSNIWPPPLVNEKDESFTHNIWPPPPSTSSYHNKTSIPLNESEDDAIFTSNIWPPPAASNQGLIDSNHVDAASLQSTNIQMNIWPPPPSNHNEPSTQSYGMNHVSSSPTQKPNHISTHYSPPNTKDTTTVQNKPEKPHAT